jgi:hypothetical protein
VERKAVITDFTTFIQIAQKPTLMAPPSRLLVLVRLRLGIGVEVALLKRSRGIVGRSASTLTEMIASVISLEAVIFGALFDRET